jgi:hypothetical protein
MPYVSNPHELYAQLVGKTLVDIMHAPDKHGRTDTVTLVFSGGSKVTFETSDGDPLVFRFDLE